MALLKAVAGNAHQPGCRAGRLPDRLRRAHGAARHGSPVDIGRLGGVSAPAAARPAADRHRGRRRGRSWARPHPIVVQSMTNTDTADADATALQVAALAHAGSELVRVTVNNDAAARGRAGRSGASSTTWASACRSSGDFHYNGHQLLAEHPDAARGARQVPHQPGQRRRQAPRRALRDDRPGRHRHDKPVRIGVNWGSLDQALLTDADGRERPLGRRRSTRAT